MKEHSFVSVVLYIRNCEKQIAAFYDNLVGVLTDKFKKFELIFVNDASTDRSVSVIEEKVGKTHDFVATVLHMGYFQGMEVAMNAGRDIAIGDYVYEFDSLIMDYDPKLIADIFDESKNGYDIVAAAPKKGKGLFTKLYYRFFSSLNSETYQIRTERFRLLTRRAINQVTAMNVSTPYRKVVYASVGFAMKTVVYDNEKQKKQKEMGGKYRMNLATESLLLFTQTGYRFSLCMTFVMMFITLCVGIYAVVVNILGTPIEGWTTLIFFLSFAFFGLFGILAIVVKYLSIILQMVLKRKHYTVARIEKINNK